MHSGAVDDAVEPINMHSLVVPERIARPPARRPDLSGYVASSPITRVNSFVQVSHIERGVDAHFYKSRLRANFGEKQRLAQAK